MRGHSLVHDQPRACRRYRREESQRTRGQEDQEPPDFLARRIRGNLEYAESRSSKPAARVSVFMTSNLHDARALDACENRDARPRMDRDAESSSSPARETRGEALRRVRFISTLCAISNGSRAYRFRRLSGARRKRRAAAEPAARQGGPRISSRSRRPRRNKPGCPRRSSSSRSSLRCCRRTRACFGVDLGEKTIGLALSDTRRTIASPFENPEAGRNSASMPHGDRAGETARCRRHRHRPSAQHGRDPKARARNRPALSLRNLAPMAELAISFWDERLSDRSGDPQRCWKRTPRARAARKSSIKWPPPIFCRAHSIASEIPSHEYRR